MIENFRLRKGILQYVDGAGLSLPVFDPRVIKHFPRTYAAFSGAFRAPFQPAFHSGGAAAFSPTSVPGLQIWLKTDGLLWQDAARTVPAVADGDAVGCWDDSSSGGYNAIQAVVGSKPTLKLAIQNAHSVLRCDGGDNLVPTLTMNNHPLSIFVIFALALDVTFQHGGVLTHNSATPYKNLWYGGEQSGSANKQNVWKGNGTSYAGVISTNTLAQLNFHLIDMIIDSSGNVSLTRDNVADGSGTIALATTWIPCVGGTGYRPLLGDIGEILIYSAAMSANDAASIRAYLNARWAIY